MTIETKYSDKINWNLAGIILILFYLVFSFARRNLFPVFLDIYYHIGVMQGFDLARGIVTWDFWEFAPIGRPHFYPPLVHILMLIFLKLGVSKVNIAVFSSFIIFPLFVFSFWQIVKRMFSSRLAFFVALSLLSSYSIFIGLTNTLAATFCLTLLLFLFYSLYKGRKLSAILLTAMLFYTHYAVSVMGILTLGLYFLFTKEKKTKLLLIAAGIILALPWIANFARNIGYLEKVVHYERGMEINLLTLSLAMIGIFLGLKIKGPHLFFIFLLLVGLAGTVKYPYRFFSTQPAAALIFLSALTAEKIFVWLSLRKLIRPKVLLCSLIFFFHIFSASIVFSGGDNNAVVKEVRLAQDSLFWNLAIFPHQDSMVHNFRDVSLYRSSQGEFDKIIGLINSSTDKGDIIYSNYSYEAGMFCAFTERANATMSPYNITEGSLARRRFVRNAKLILWLKNTDDIMENELIDLIREMRLEKIAETKMFYIYKNPAVRQKMKISSAVLPSGAAFLIVFISFGLIGWDMLRRD